jgi:magnesium transporter
MLQRYDEQAHAFRPTESVPDAGWVHVVAPTATDLALLRGSLAMPSEVLRHAVDVDELARMDHHEDGTDLIVLRVPWCLNGEGVLPYRAASFSIILHRGVFLTIAPGPDEIVGDLLSRGPVPISDPGLLVTTLLICAAERFLFHLKAIDVAVNTLEESLREAQENREVIALLHYQKGLVHLITALGSNQIMLERLQKNERMRLSPRAHAVLDDALVELRQATEMTRVSSDILGQMMDAFASIISNNLNVVMKLLTVLTSVLAVPTVISSFYGMNVLLPGQHSPHAFQAVLGSSALLAGLLVWTMLRKRLL